MVDTPATGDTGAAATAAAAAAAAVQPWFHGADAETVGHIQNRGWDKLTAAEAAVNAVKSHREAEKHLGVPADQLLRMPKDAADAEGQARLNERLGVPKEVKDYDFSTVKFADGTDLEASFTEALAPALLAARVSKDAAPGVVKAITAFLDKSEATETAEKASALAAERETLRINWGSNVEANMLVAKQAAAALGVDEKAVQALENVVGYAKVMEMFRNIGTKIGEDVFVANRAPGGAGVMSGDQAVATLAEKQADAAWVTKLNAGDTTALKEFHNLTTVIAAARRAQ